ncbi:phosphoglycerate kinase [Magnetospira sp. QH-2]|uniref:phosphoglycerate kinase n=1 Tax=Magnetospira sp. (strain QH-2) TaxID=1288970 RepID=UPI0003E8168F|nr:phosphoglycerate kinase [Magnetospira sp. QH-2]CCQ75036.1 phosphoglycerate kinase [Magnetospira sp. QH-2]
MSAFKTIDTLDVAGKRVFVRADLNVPMKDGVVTNTTRIDRTVATLKELSEKGGRVIVTSHLGRPKGEKNPEFTMKPVAEALGKAMGQDIPFATDCVGNDAKAVIDTLGDGDICMLENLRYYAGEEKNDPAFVDQLADLADVYVNDAFSTAHRAHASTEGLARKLPAAAGRLMQAELEALSNALESPARPVAAVVGGAKISTKLEVLGTLASKVDVLIIGGGMANTFLNAKGVNVGKSLCEHEMAETAREMLVAAEKAGCTVMLPVDGVVAKEFAANAANQVVDINDIPEDSMVLDAGPKTVAELSAKLKECKTIVWNGPLGAFEITPFDKATVALAQEAAEMTKAGTLLSVAGGGDTVAALEHAGVKETFSYVSTAGGAFLEWLEGKDLPGVEVVRA